MTAYYLLTWTVAAAVNFWMWRTFHTEVKYVALFTSGVFAGWATAVIFVWLRV